ncbi:MAG: ExeM/NucH family extracellular endonuclease [Marinobacter sp.]|uniref:ExeM/NucH family extracellular endonuclease n=1 Tax=Marinobacter sp. TaxID=50741 RepID=UPI0034A0AB9C
MVGETVTVEGVMTMDARGDGGFQGFYLQQADNKADNNSRTSEALFVYTSRTAGTPGRRIRLSGRVKEYHGLTELVHITALKDCGSASLPEAIQVTLPWPDGTYPEHLENMHVRIATPLTVIDHYNLDRYGELTLAPNQQFTATQTMAPGPEAVALTQEQRARRLTLDDGRGQRNPKPVPYPPPALAHDHTVRAGDRVRHLQGVLDYRFGSWRLQPLSPPEFETRNPRPEPPGRPETSTLRVATMNLENYFNGNGNDSGFPATRGADSQAALGRQTARLVATLTGLDADIIAVMEIENDGSRPDSAIAQLAAAMGENWRFSVSDHHHRDVIRSAFLFNSQKVQMNGEPHIITTGPFQNSGRVPLVQTFRVSQNGYRIRLVATHFKSKSCRGATGRNQDQNDGQGCFGATRTRAAEAIIDWLSRTPAEPASEALTDSSDDMGTLITGDLNSYAMEPPLTRLRDAGFVDLLRHFQGLESYSYRYRGGAGTLDYILADTTLRPYVINAASWSVNADEPAALGYRNQSKPVPAPWRSSDHDPIVVDLAF